MSLSSVFVRMVVKSVQQGSVSSIHPPVSHQHELKTIPNQLKERWRAEEGWMMLMLSPCAVVSQVFETVSHAEYLETTGDRSPLDSLYRIRSC
jgi:hypothetical protein